MTEGTTKLRLARRLHEERIKRERLEATLRRMRKRFDVIDLAIAYAAGIVSGVSLGVAIVAVAS